MKVFNVSPHRSGTQSFHAFCLAHGLRSAHWPGPDVDNAAQFALYNRDLALLWRICGTYYAGADIFSDFPTSFLYAEAVKEVPRAKYVLIERDPVAWRKSVKLHTAGRGLGFLERIFYTLAIGERDFTKGLNGYTDTELEEGYRRHCERAKTLLKNCGVNLFVGTLGDPSIGEQIGEFLGFEVKHPFEVIS